jgi:hypothetical protein
MRRLVIGRRTKSILGRLRFKSWRRSTGFDMDRFEIVVCRSNGEAVFSVFLQKMAFSLKKE